MTDYTIVEPSFKLMGVATPVNYMEFLELCTRNCYKSEEHIKLDSAVKLLSKVVKEYKHLSITEHARAILEIHDVYASEEIYMQLLQAQPLFQVTLDEDSTFVRVSGNVRNWREFTERHPPEGEKKCWFGKGIDSCLNAQWPFFFPDEGEEHKNIRLVDNNPMFNSDKLPMAEMCKHMAVTGRFIGSRAMSHQLVRHRLAAYSQESQRYCNYGKKGFQFIIPPYFKENGETFYIHSVLQAYQNYLQAVDNGALPEDARFFMPNACKTEVVATFTLDMWKHTIEHRGHNPKAQWEIRKLFLQAEEQLSGLFPEIF